MLTVDVTSDIVCPWCFIGERRLAAVAKELGVELDVRFHAFELMPGMPAEGVEVGEYLRKKYGREPAQMYATVEAAARDAGLELDLTKQGRARPTLAAHTLLRHARAKGTQWALADALFEGHFKGGKNIAGLADLTEVAAPHGFDADEVARLLSDPAEVDATRAETREASRQGITGVPFFVFGGTLAFSGAQPAAVFRQAITRASAE